MEDPKHTPTLALVHEQDLLRKALGRELRELAPYQLTVEVADAAGFKRAFALSPPPTVVVLSVESALADGCALLRWRLKHMTNTRTMLVGPEPPVRTLVQMMRAGAHGICCTRTQLALLRTKLDTVIAGALAFPDSFEAYLRDHLPEPKELPARMPTAREHQVLVLISRKEGLTQEAIAQELELHVSGVKAICARLCRHYQVKGRSGLALLGVRLGLVVA